MTEELQTPKENPAKPGTALKELYALMGFRYGKHCTCKKVQKEMDEKGPEWCRENLDTIVESIQQEARRRGIPFLPSLCKFSVKVAIRVSEMRAAGISKSTPQEQFEQASKHIKSEAVKAEVESQSSHSATPSSSAKTPPVQPQQPAPAQTSQQTVPAQTSPAQQTGTGVSASPGAAALQQSASASVVPPSQPPASNGGASAK